MKNLKFDLLAFRVKIIKTYWYIYFVGEASKTVGEYKIKLQNCEQTQHVLQTSVSFLILVSNYKHKLYK